MNPLVLKLVAPAGAVLLAGLGPTPADSTRVDSTLADAIEGDSPSLMTVPAPAAPRGRQVIIAPPDNMPVIVPDMAGLLTPVVTPPVTSDMPIVVPPNQPTLRLRPAARDTLPE